MSLKANIKLTFRMLLSCTCWPEKASHPYRTTTWCSSFLTSISADASNSELIKPTRRVRPSASKILIHSNKQQEEAIAYRLIGVKIPWGRGHVLRDVGIDFVPILIDLGWRKPRLTCLLKLELLSVILSGLERYCQSSQFTKGRQKKIHQFRDLEQTQKPRSQIRQKKMGKSTSNKS
jgi:hypothetical protein